MKASELRIGNIVYRTIEETWLCPHITGLDIYDCVQHPERYSPIPLTEEWLLRFGFGKNGECPKRLKVDSEYGEFIIYPHVLAKYVHQFQNLYFALTGEELSYTN